MLLLKARRLGRLGLAGKARLCYANFVKQVLSQLKQISLIPPNLKKVPNSQLVQFVLSFFFKTRFLTPNQEHALVHKDTGTVVVQVF
jgi:hypothetical protein